MISIGEGKLKKELQKKSELFDNVNFHQKINNEDLLNKYSEYSFYLSLSDYEGNSKTILEALGSGCIVIASNIPNNLEIISNNSNGFIFENSKENLIKLLDKIINDPGIMMKISKEAKAYIERNNSIEVILNKEFEILTKLV